jgi:signal transduction histidine kinase
MADLGRPPFRFTVVVLLGVIAVVEFQSLTQMFRSHARLRERALGAARQALLQARPQLEAYFASGDPGALKSGVEAAVTMTAASEAALLDASGRLLFTSPSTATLPSGLPREDALGVPPGSALVLGPVLGLPSRILSYASFPAGNQRVVLKLATAVPDLVADLRDRERAFAAHAVGLLALVIAGALCVAPNRGEWAPTSPRALEAYVEAMGRLGERGHALSAQHAAERRQMEETIHAQEAMARAGELTSGIVHELRNGLGTILGYARLMEREATPQVVEAAQGILEECETLGVVIRRFMEFVKSESLALLPFDLRAMLSRVVAREGRSTPGASLQLSDGDMGTLAADEELLERAIENLVRNAREAAGPQGHVWIGVARDALAVTVTISDDGPGVSAADKDRMRPFFTTKPGGLGLGLPIAHKIVALHQGELSFSDHVPRGLTVRVRLPFEGADAPVVTNGSVREGANVRSPEQ